MRKYTLFLLIAVLLSSTAGWAAAPRTLSYQGALKDAAGTVLDGYYDLTFSLYDAAINGELLWSEAQNVLVTAGVFSVVLGEINALDLLFDQSYWIGLTLDGESEMTPRTQLTAAPYALRAITTENVELQHVGAFYRWAVFSTYDNAAPGWLMDNDPDLFGGVTPSNWTDASATANQMGPDKEVLRTLFTRKGYGGANANVHSHVYTQYSSTNGEIVAVLFRIRNNTAFDLTWTPEFHYSCYFSYGEKASVALNGSHMWESGSSNDPGHTSVVLSIPAARTSTVIVVSGSGPVYSPGGGLLVRQVVLAFDNDSLALPAGLEYVDDLDTATGGWEQ